MTETPRARADLVTQAAATQEAAALLRAQNTAYYLSLFGAILWKLVLVAAVVLIGIGLAKFGLKLLEWFPFWVDEIVKWLTAVRRTKDGTMITVRNEAGETIGYKMLAVVPGRTLPPSVEVAEPTKKRDDGFTPFEPADPPGNGHLLTNIEKVLELLEGADAINPDSNVLPSHGKMDKTAEWWNARKNILEAAGLVFSIPNRHTVLIGKWRTVGELLEAVEQGRANLRPIPAPPPSKVASVENLPA